MNRYGREYLVVAAEVLTRLVEYSAALPSVNTEVLLRYSKPRCKIVAPHQDEKILNFIDAVLSLV